MRIIDVPFIISCNIACLAHRIVLHRTDFITVDLLEMAIRRQWTAIEMLLMMALVAINGCIIGGSVLLTASGWAWTFIPLSLLPAVFQVCFGIMSNHHLQPFTTVTKPSTTILCCRPSQLLALCSAAAAAQKPMPADRTCANSVWWVVMLVIVGSGLAGVLGAASLTLYTACVCPDCIAGQPGVLFDRYVMVLCCVRNNPSPQPPPPLSPPPTYHPKSFQCMQQSAKHSYTAPRLCPLCTDPVGCAPPHIRHQPAHLLHACLSHLHPTHAITSSGHPRWHHRHTTGNALRGGHPSCRTATPQRCA